MSITIQGMSCTVQDGIAVITMPAAQAGRLADELVWVDVRSRQETRTLFYGIRAALEKSRARRAPAPESPVVVGQVPSSTRRGVAYEVIRRADGTLACPCKGFFYRGECRHLAQV